jgi:hypothetical protein
MKDRPELEKLLAKARDYVMTKEEREAQRKSWAVGELMLSHPTMTRQEAERRYDNWIEDDR